MSYLSQDRLSTSSHSSSDRPVLFISDTEIKLSLDRVLCSLFRDKLSRLKSHGLNSGVMGNAIASLKRGVDAPS